MIVPTFQPELIAQIRASLDLRRPNVDALETIVVNASRELGAGDATSFEGVVEMATGVGKTYVMAALIDYFAAQGGRNFAIVTPGRTVTRKTIANFTSGHPKSLLGGMETTPVVIAADNFDNPSVAEALADESIVKLYIFTVQALLTPTSKADRRTHEFQESLGAAFYARLREADDLLVMADEYHLYSAKKFRAAVAGLEPQILVGLTATAPRGSPVIFRYPLAAAIADKYVKSPVIVGRPDDRADAFTKLTDGLRLLERKARAVEIYRAERPGLPVINPVMLVIAPDTAAADEVTALLRRPDLAGGAYADAVLPVHSNLTGEDAQAALAELDAVEDPDSRVRVIVSVGMLKEGWDVRNVYVICSLRASVSEILTEQTLGRGLRLPFGRRTGTEVLDTLEVVAHERYDELLKRVEKTRIELMDYRTTLAAGEGDEPTPVPTEAGVDVVDSPDGSATAGAITIAGIDQRLDHTDATAPVLGAELRPRAVEPPLLLPIVTVAPVTAPFSLNQITDLQPFREDGRRIAVEPEDRLRRTILAGTVTTEADGRKIASLTRQRATIEVKSAGAIVPLAVSRQHVVEVVINSGAVASRAGEVNRLGEIVDAFCEGLGADAEKALSAFGGRAATALITRIRAAQATVKPAIQLSDDIDLRAFEAVRFGRPKVHDRGEPFEKGDGYTGFTKSIYAQDWFDSETGEFALAGLVDGAPEIAWWLRLQRGDLPLPWASGNYNPDFIVAETSGDRWVVEGKSDRDIANEDVVAKRRAANQWANHVRNLTGARWHYMFVSESEIKTAKENWPALKRLSLAE